MTRSVNPCSVYRHLNSAGETLYIGCSANPLQRTAAHQAKAPWLRMIANISIQWFSTKEEALAEEDRLIRAECPPYNRALTPRRSKWSNTQGGAALQAWMQRNGVDKSQLAKALRTTGYQVSNLFFERASPRHAKACRISIITSGEVPSNSWYGTWPIVPPCAEDAVSSKKWLEREGMWVPHPMITTPTRSAAA